MADETKATKYFVLQAMEYEGGVVLPGASMEFPKFSDVQLARLVETNVLQPLSADATRTARQALTAGQPVAQAVAQTVKK